MILKPLDIVCVHGLNKYPHHLMIKWRGLDPIVHCFMLSDSDGNGYNPLFKGIEHSNISMYKGRDVTICRHKYLHEEKINTILKWCEDTSAASVGYDFFRQWLLGFVLGFTKQSLVNDEFAWTCSEFAYWAFQDNGVRITAVDEPLPMPRLFKYHNDFDVVFEGKLIL